MFTSHLPKVAEFLIKVLSFFTENILQLFEELLSSDRDRHTDRVEQVLRSRCSEIKRSPCRGELEVMKLACLVDRSALPEFEAGVFQAASLFDDNFAFDYNGPWAPHNFVEMAVEI